MVFKEGLPITMVPLEVTHTVVATEDIFLEFEKLTSSFGKKMSPMFRHFQRRYKEMEDFDFPVAHDPCAIYYLLHP